MSLSNPSLGKRASWRLEALAYDIVSGLMRLFPVAWVSAFGGWLLRVIGPRTSKHKIAETGLRIAFPDKSDEEINDLLTQQWDNIGRTFAEFPLTHRIMPFTPKSRITVHGLDIFKANAPAIMISGHFANWELMATVLTQSGLPVRVTYRKINNPHIDARVVKQREAYGTKFLVQNPPIAAGGNCSKPLKKAKSIAILNDQKFDTGLAVPFFGHTAMTAQGATRLALKTGRPLMPMVVARDGSDFTVTFHDPINLTKTGNREADTEAGVRQVNAYIEDRIRENPAQWFWVHRRWPKDVYKKD